VGQHRGHRGRGGVLCLVTGILLALLIACSPSPAAPAGGLAPRNAPVGAASQSPGAGQSPADAGGQAASAPAAAGPLTTFRFVFPGVNFSSLPFHIADTHGLYKRYGIEVETLTMPSVTSVAALVNGDLEAIGSFGSSVKASVAGHPIKVVFATADTQLFDFVTRPEIQRPEQLRGKIVSASEAGGTQDLATLAALTHFGLTEQDVQYLRSRIENQVRLEQLRLGQIDAGAFNPPLNLQAKREGFNVLVSTKDIYPLPLTGVAARASSLTDAKERDVLLRFLKGTVAAMEWIRANRGAASAEMADWLGYDRALAEETYDASLQGMSADGTAGEVAMRNAIQAALEGGSAGRTVAIADVADWSLAQQALREVRAGQ
jgi:NitT/TauT family transport system substrate-binding protein